MSGAKTKLVIKRSAKAKKALKVTVKGRRLIIKFKKANVRGNVKLKVWARKTNAYKKSNVKTLRISL